MRDIFYLIQFKYRVKLDEESESDEKIREKISLSLIQTLKWTKNSESAFIFTLYR
jgi:hypothetical protein